MSPITSLFKEKRKKKKENEKNHFVYDYLSDDLPAPTRKDVIYLGSLLTSQETSFTKYQMRLQNKFFTFSICPFTFP